MDWEVGIAGGGDSYMGMPPRSACVRKVQMRCPSGARRSVGLGGRRPDSQVLPTLIERLGDTDPVVRLAANEALRKRTGLDFGYVAWANPEERAVAIGRWRDLGESRARQSRSGGPAARSSGPTIESSPSRKQPDAGSVKATVSMQTLSTTFRSMFQGGMLGRERLPIDLESWPGRPCHGEGFPRCIQPRPRSPAHILLGPVGWLGRSLLAVTAYVGGVTLLGMAALGSILWPRLSRDQSAAAPEVAREDANAPSFLGCSLRAFPWWGWYTSHSGRSCRCRLTTAVRSSTARAQWSRCGFTAQHGRHDEWAHFCRNHGHANDPGTAYFVRTICCQPQPSTTSHDSTSQPLSPDDTRNVEERKAPSIAPGRLAAPGSRRRGSPVSCFRNGGSWLARVVGWQASQSLMGVPTATFFMMMTKMMWFRDVVGLVVKGFLFGAGAGNDLLL